MQLTDRSGQLRDTLYSVSGFRAPDGRPDGLIGVIVDISPLKEAGTGSRARPCHRRIGCRRQGGFPTNMSHEIRTR